MSVQSYNPIRSGSNADERGLLVPYTTRKCVWLSLLLHMTGTGERGKHGFRVRGGATAGAHVGQVTVGGGGGGGGGRRSPLGCGWRGSWRTEMVVASWLGWTRRGWVGWGFRLLLEALGSQYILSLYIYIHTRAHTLVIKLKCTQVHPI
jgi:hypothetical protein